MMWPISDRHAGNRIPLGIMDDLKSRAARFAESWAGRGDEKSDTQQYWRGLLDKVLLIPDTSDRQTLWFERRTALIEAGRNVLVARANHPGQSLADLYDPDYMPTDLRAAHRELDKVADVAFGARKWLKDDDDARLQVLFKSYTRMTGSSEV